MTVAPRAGAWIEAPRPVLCTSKATSLPVRERGLKQLKGDFQAQTNGSLPVRERGLKQYIVRPFWVWAMSLPVRERGLKLALVAAGVFESRRSPCGSVD